MSTHTHADIAISQERRELVGLPLNSTLGWPWADPIAALVIAAVAVKEGLEAWRGDSCCAPGMHLPVEDEVPVMVEAATMAAPPAPQEQTQDLSAKQKPQACSCCPPDRTNGSK